MVDFSQKPTPVAKKVETPPIPYMNAAKDEEIAKLKAALKALEHVSEKLRQQTLQQQVELDIDGFQAWISTLSPDLHIEKPFIIQLQKYGHKSWLLYFKTLYQKYQKR